MTDASPNPTFAPLEDAIRTRLDEMAKRYAQLRDMMGSQEIATNPAKLREVSKEYASLAKSVEPFEALKRVWTESEEARQMLAGADADPDLSGLAEEELAGLAAQEDRKSVV